MRHRIKLIYGANSDVINQFPMIPEDFPPGQALDGLRDRIGRLEKFLSSLQTIAASTILSANRGGRVFIGHGRSPVWRELKDFLHDRLRLPWDEFNREAVAGFTTFERLDEMLGSASFAFLLMTAEDEHVDASLHARENVVHEVGLFQGRLGPRRAIILLEDGCEEFSNIVGLSQIRFPRGRVSAAFEEIRRVLEREGVVAA
jgi:predicted nucleotide-binding protein